MASNRALPILLDQIDAVLALHRESHNEFNNMDAWPSGHCNHDGQSWPCATARRVGENR